MAAIGIMLEGQFGLTWGRWQRILQAAEDFGYQCVFRSDHYTTGAPDQESLETWVSLTYAADHTRRIEFGPLVSPVTFRHPSMLARMAAAVDDLSGGRLVFGLGAGWNEYEHHKFGVPFYDKKTRFDMLEDALEMTTRLLRDDGPVSFQGKRFSLDEAILLPRPQRPGGPPILVGGKGPRRTLPLAARYADEWNGVFMPLELFRERSTLLDDLLQKEGRRPGDVKRSLMTGVVFGKNDADLRGKLAEDGRSADELVAAGWFAGTASALVDQIGRFVEAGVERFMLNWFALDDIEGLELMARDVLPHFHKAK